MEAADDFLRIVRFYSYTHDDEEEGKCTIVSRVLLDINRRSGPLISPLATTPQMHRPLRDGVRKVGLARPILFLDCLTVVLARIARRSAKYV